MDITTSSLPPVPFTCDTPLPLSLATPCHVPDTPQLTRIRDDLSSDDNNSLENVEIPGLSRHRNFSSINTTSTDTSTLRCGGGEESMKSLFSPNTTNNLTNPMIIKDSQEDTNDSQQAADFVITGSRMGDGVAVTSAREVVDIDDDETQSPQPQEHISTVRSPSLAPSGRDSMVETSTPHTGVSGSTKKHFLKLRQRLHTESPIDGGPERKLPTSKLATRDSKISDVFLNDDFSLITIRATAASKTTASTLLSTDILKNSTHLSRQGDKVYSPKADGGVHGDSPSEAANSSSSSKRKKISSSSDEESVSSNDAYSPYNRKRYKKLVKTCSIASSSLRKKNNELSLLKKKHNVVTVDETSPSSDGNDQDDVSESDSLIFYTSSGTRKRPTSRANSMKSSFRHTPKSPPLSSSSSVTHCNVKSKSRGSRRNIESSSPASSTSTPKVSAWLSAASPMVTNRNSAGPSSAIATTRNSRSSDATKGRADKSASSTKQPKKKKKKIGQTNAEFRRKFVGDDDDDGDW